MVVLAPTEIDPMLMNESSIFTHHPPLLLLILILICMYIAFWSLRWLEHGAPFSMLLHAKLCPHANTVKAWTHSVFCGRTVEYKYPLKWRRVIVRLQYSGSN